MVTIFGLILLGTLKTLDPNNDSDWETSFTFCTNLTDRASNQSPSVCRSVSTPVRPPREGECVIGGSGKDSIEDKVRNGERDSTGKLLNPIDPNQVGLGKSCQVYEPDLVNDLITHEEKKVVDKIKAENEAVDRENEAEDKKLKDEQDKYAKELNDSATCIQNKLNDYSNNKGSGNSADTELNNWVNECGANKDILTLQIDQKGDGNTQSFEDIIKNNVDGIKQSYSRGTTEGCSWNSKWPWEKGSCVREGVAEGVYYLGEGVGYVMAVGTLPLNAAISATQSLFNKKSFQENLTDNFSSVQNGASNGARAVLNGIGTVVGSLINLNANAYNLVGSIGQTAVGCFTGQPCSLDQIGNNYENNKSLLQDNFGYDMGDWKQNAAIVVTTAVVVAATIFTGGLAATLVGGAIGAGAVATGAGLATAYLVGNVLSYLGGSVMNGKFLDPKEFACGNKEADPIECVSYQGGQLLTGAILTEGIGLVIPKGATTKVSNVTKSIDDLKKVPGYLDDVDDIKLKNGGSGTSTKVNIDGGEYLFDGEFYYKDGKTYLRVLDPDGSLSVANGKMVPIKQYRLNNVKPGDSLNTASGKVLIPDGYVYRIADNGKGAVFQKPGAQGNVNMVRVMDSTSDYPNGYIRVYNEYGQPINIITGKPGTSNGPDTHLSINP